MSTKTKDNETVEAAPSGKPPVPESTILSIEAIAAQSPNKTNFRIITGVETPRLIRFQLNKDSETIWAAVTAIAYEGVDYLASGIGPNTEFGSVQQGNRVTLHVRPAVLIDGEPVRNPATDGLGDTTEITDEPELLMHGRIFRGYQYGLPKGKDGLVVRPQGSNHGFPMRANDTINEKNEVTGTYMNADFTEETGNPGLERLITSVLANHKLYNNPHVTALVNFDDTGASGPVYISREWNAPSLKLEREQEAAREAAGGGKKQITQVIATAPPVESKLADAASADDEE